MLYAVHARADVFTGAETVDVWIPLHCFDAVGLVIWPVKIVPEMTYYVLSGMLSLYTTTISYLRGGWSHLEPPSAEANHRSRPNAQTTTTTTDTPKIQVGVSDTPQFWSTL